MPVSTMDDWVCNSCGASVFGARLECFKCGQEWQNNPILSSDSESDDENELHIPSSSPPLKNKEDASKKFHIIDEEEFNRFLSRVWNRIMNDLDRHRPECFLTSFYEESKSMASLRKHDALGRRKQLPNKPVLIHSPIEVLPIVYDTILYHDTLSVRFQLDYVYKVTEGGNLMHLPCEQCQCCNAIYDTEKGALCFSCT